MLKAIIVENEARSRNMLTSLLKDYCLNVKLISSVDSVIDAINAIQQYSPDIVFLDIELDDETGFDLLKKITNIEFEVIFTTAHEHYAINAIKFCAIDYLLKPIDVSELILAIEKVEKRKTKNIASENLSVLLQNINAGQRNEHQIAVSSMEGLTFIRVSNILYCESDGPYTIIYLKDDDKIISSRHLKEYEVLLKGYSFFRIHKSFLINLSEIKKYFRGDGGQVLMANGASIDVSKRKKMEFLQIISKI